MKINKKHSFSPGVLVRIIPNKDFVDSVINKIGIVLGSSLYFQYPVKVLVDEKIYVLAEDEIEELPND